MTMHDDDDLIRMTPEELRAAQRPPLPDTPLGEVLALLSLALCACIMGLIVR